MADLISWLSANWLVLIMVATSVVGGASMIVKAIAPLTKSNLDNRIVKWLDKLHSLLSKVALNPPANPPSEEG